MNRKTCLALGLLAGVFFSGCAAPRGNSMYYFGHYSQTLYACEKNQTEATLLNHKQELEKIISESEAKKLPVPPGIYAELGYINLKANKSPEAIALFQSEAQLYPESKMLMDRLIQSAKARDKVEDKAPDLSATKESAAKE